MEQEAMSRLNAPAQGRVRASTRTAARMVDEGTLKLIREALVRRARAARLRDCTPRLFRRTAAWPGNATPAATSSISPWHMGEAFTRPPDAGRSRAALPEMLRYHFRSRTMRGCWCRFAL